MPAVPYFAPARVVLALALVLPLLTSAARAADAVLEIFVNDMRTLTVRMRPPGGSITLKELAVAGDDTGL